MDKIVAGGKSMGETAFRLIGCVVLSMLVACLLAACVSEPTETIQPSSTVATEPTETLSATDLPLPLPTDTPTPHPTKPPKLHNQWRGIVPGQSTAEDVTSILGHPNQVSEAPTMGSGSTRFPTWRYGTIQHKLAPLYQDRGKGLVDIRFLDEVVFTVDIGFSFDDRWYDVAHLIEDFGEPEIILNTEPRPPSNPSQSRIIEEQGLDWQTTTTRWLYAYPSLGISASIADWVEGYENTVPVWYPQGSLPPADVPVAGIQFYESMGVDEYRASVLYPLGGFIEIPLP